MRALPWILGGGAAALAGYYWQRSRDGSDTNADGDKHADPSPSSGHRGDASAPAANGSTGSPAPAPERLPGRWVWPLGVLHQHVQEQLHGQLQDHLQDRFPEISDGFYSKRRSPSGQEVTHGGVDIMYRRKPGDPWKPGTPNGSPGWVMPDHRAALAASDGVVWSAANTPRGWTVVIDHAPRKLATYYTHLSSLLVTAKQPVSVGTPLGIIGADPLDAERIMHLHFEVWRGGSTDRFDPQRLIETTWEYVPDPGDLPRELVARNGGHRPPDGSSSSVPVRPHYRRPPRR